MFESIKRLSFKHKNNKIKYYLSSYLRMLTPGWVYQCQLSSWLKRLDNYDKAYIRQRVDYYNKLNGASVQLDNGYTIERFKVAQKA